MVMILTEDDVYALAQGAGLIRDVIENALRTHDHDCPAATYARVLLRLANAELVVIPEGMVVSV